MSAIASIKAAGPISETLVANALDGILKTAGDAAIGVQRTFDPDGFQTPGVARWVDRSGGIAIGYPAMSLSVRPPSKASRMYRVTVKVTLPTLEQTSPSTASGIQPAPTLAYYAQFNGEFLLPERSLRWERIALLNNVMSLLATTITASDGDPSDSTGSPVPAAVVDFDPPY